MKKLILALLLINVYVLASYAQDDFKIVTEVKTTSVKDQDRSGTCWSFATVSYIEAELLRMGKWEVDLSEMFFVNKAYIKKAENYVRLQGKSNFGPGGQAHDVINIIRDYGMVPETACPGICYGEEGHDHTELDALLLGMVKSMTTKTVKHKGNIWLSAVEAVVETYLGEIPETFNYKGKDYTPKTFQSFLGFNPDDYIEITSYEAYPFYSKVMLQVPDNWSYNLYYNVPLVDFMSIIENALNKNYSVCWDGDVSGGFGGSTGIAELKDETLEISDPERQTAFDLFESTDDHLMHLVGIAKDKEGKTYFKTKNSWSADTKYDGFWFMSENYVKLNTVAILIHKDAIPKEIANRMGIK